MYLLLNKDRRQLLYISYMVSEEKGAALISNRFLSSELSALVFVRTKPSGCVPYSCVACLLVCLFACLLVCLFA